MPVRIIRPGRRTGEHPDGTIVVGDHQQDPNGPFIVEYDEAGQPYRQENYPAGTIFDVDEPHHRHTDNGIGIVTTEVVPEGRLRTRTTTREAEWAKRAVVVALILLAIVGTAWFVGGGKNATAATATDITATTDDDGTTADPAAEVDDDRRPRCAKQQAECRTFAAALGESSAPCAEITEGCK